MTANELADKLDMVRIGLTLEAAAMLRQQQAEIEQLKALVISISHRNSNLQYTKASKK